ncbi:pericentrin-like [Paramacrobiotus metropolitanus]|uniref:pericentrin-like n=1 Tax=Paramacrobiotus metropolitanus TaxID=2943436 RepID=UPI0024463D0D|nr:pericentrin-like [Paramacrobiotus metropolitanus]
MASKDVDEDVEDRNQDLDDETLLKHAVHYTVYKMSQDCGRHFNMEFSKSVVATVADNVFQTIPAWGRDLELFAKIIPRIFSYIQYETTMTSFPKAEVKRCFDFVVGKDYPGPGHYNPSNPDHVARMSSFAKTPRDVSFSNESIYLTPMSKDNHHNHKESNKKATTRLCKQFHKPQGPAKLSFAVDNSKEKASNRDGNQHERDLMVLEQNFLSRESELTRKIVELQADLEMEKNNSNVLRADCAELAALKGELQRREQNLNEEFTELRAASESKNQESACILKEMEKLKGLEQNFLTRESEMTRKISELQADLEIEKNNSSVLRADCAELAALKGELQRREQDLNEEITQLRAASESKNTESACILKEMEKLKGLELNFLSRESELTRKIAELQADLEMEKNNSNVLRADCAELAALKGELQRREQNLIVSEQNFLSRESELTRKTVELQADLEVEKNNSSVLRADCAELAALKGELQRREQDLNEEITQLRAASELKNTESACILKELEKLKGFEQNFLTRESELTRKIVELQADLEMEKNNSNVLRADCAELAALKGELQRREQNLNEEITELRAASELKNTESACILKEMEKLKEFELNFLKRESELTRKIVELQADLEVEKNNSNVLRAECAELATLKGELQRREQDHIVSEQNFLSRESELTRKTVELKADLEMEKNNSNVLRADCAALKGELQRREQDLNEEITELRAASESKNTESACILKEMEKLKWFAASFGKYMDDKTSTVGQQIDSATFYCDSLTEKVARLKSLVYVKAQHADERKKEKENLKNVLVPLNVKSKGLTKEMGTLLAKIGDAEKRKSGLEVERRRLQQDSQGLNYRLKAVQENRSHIKAKESKMLSELQSFQEGRNHMHEYLNSKKTAVIALLNIHKPGQSFHESVLSVAKQYGEQVGHKNPSQNLRRSTFYAVENVKMKEENALAKAEIDRMEAELRKLK